MPGGRPRTSVDPNAQRFRDLNDAELAAAAPAFLPPRERWTAETRRTYAEYAQSQAAKALRAEDTPVVRRLFDYIDRLSRFWDKVPDDPDDAKGPLQSIRLLQDLVSKLSREVGFGPSARQSLGIRTETRPGSALDAFRQS
jgi:phage terminase small subunit